MKTERIPLKDKVISPQRLGDLTADLSAIANSAQIPPKNVSVQSNWSGGDRIGIMSEIVVTYDDSIESEVLKLLRDYGFIDKSDPGVPVFDRPSVQKAVRDYVSNVVETGDEDIEWVLAYDLRNPYNVCLLYLSSAFFPVDPEGQITVYRFAPDFPVAIPGRLFISFSTPQELGLALEKNPDQPLLGFIKSGDFEILHGPNGKRLKSVLPWAGSADAKPERP